MGPSEKPSVRRAREGGNAAEKMIQAGNPLNLADIFKQAFIFHLLLPETTTNI